jgi:kynurenine formamidase
VLASRGIAGIGIDTASIDRGPSTAFEAHRVLAAANIFNLENLTNVDGLPETGFAIVALPMKIEGGTGGPTRVVAVVPR